MSGQFQVDVDELTKFATAIIDDSGQSGLIPLIKNDPDLQNQLNSLVAAEMSHSGQQLYWGQDLFAEAFDLSNAEGRYRVQYGQLMSGLSQFLGALQTLAEVARVVAQNYKDAVSFDSVNGQTVTDALNSLSPTQNQSSGG